MRRIYLLLLTVIVMASSTPILAEKPETFVLFDKSIGAMAISPDGKILAVGSDNGEIALWDIAEEKVVMRLKHHTGGVRAIQFSLEGSVLISGATDGLICFSSAESGELQQNVQTMGVVTDACLSPDGKQLAVSFKEGTQVQILDPATGQETGRFTLPFNEPINGTNAGSVLAYSSDGSLLAASSGGRAWPDFKGAESTISLWNVADWSLHASFVGDRFQIKELDISPDGQWLAGATNRGKTIKLWEIPSPRAKDKGMAERDLETVARWIKELDSDEFNARKAAHQKLIEFGPAARKELTEAAKNGSMEVKFRAGAILEKLSYGDVQPKYVLPGSPFDTQFVAFSPDGKWLASGRQFDQPGNVILYELAKPSSRIVTPHQHGAWVVLFSNDGKQLFTGRRDGAITKWSR